MTAPFPAGFVWGAATSAHQIEGAPLADGAGPSNWYRFSHTRGRTAFGETADVACDHYHRWAEDVELMAALGLGSYRFSIAWSRVLPTGRGSVNRKGLDFYARLVDGLLERGIQPNATLYHWDLPAALDDLGGWLNHDSAQWFADYATIVFDALGDRVALWATLNEPWVVVDAGYVHGVHAPGHRSLFEAARAAHNVLRAHGAAVQAYRASAARGRIGVVVNLEPKFPATDRPRDLEAVRRADAYMNRQYLDPLLLGSYPEELPGIFGEAWPEHDPAELTAIKQPIDFLGINYYKRAVTRHNARAWPVHASHVRQPQHVHTTMGWDWEVFAPGLTHTLCWVRDRYGNIPLYVTENGAAFYDPPVALAGAIADPLRIDYLRKHISAAADAIRQGVDLRGYYVWSLLDNYEWAGGYASRFGIVHVNYATLKRTPKASANFYADVIRSNGAVVADHSETRDR
ncbi:MAG TPA: GH1 family beta-glucosidase [Longimicrobiales bacterium]|nr:GH1 family beta-glucosidase [Longimicrobiales bacterium]